MKNLYWYILGLLLVVSCSEISQKDNATKDIWAYPGVYEEDSVVNIQAYFDSLCNHLGGSVWTHNPEEGESIEVWNAVNELHRYVNHQRKYYPVNEVGAALRHMAFEQGYCYSHSGEDPDSVNSGEAFLFRFIEQSALHSPQLDFVTTFHAEDGNAGILYFPEWSTINPLYSFLVYRTKQGFKVITIGKKGDAKINKIFRLLDKRGRIYYLCSNNDDAIYFRQYLYGWDGETMRFLCNADSIVGWDSYDDGYKIVFNPDKLTWSYCLPKNNVYQKVDGTKTFELSLDWQNSRFCEVTTDNKSYEKKTLHNTVILKSRYK